MTLEEVDGIERLLLEAYVTAEDGKDLVRALAKAARLTLVERKVRAVKTAARERKHRKAVLGRVCRWCKRGDDVTNWSGVRAECSRCDGQRRRHRCGVCDGPFYPNRDGCLNGCLKKT